MAFALTVKTNMISKNTADLSQAQKLSLWLSSLCLIHCLITPFVILLLPSVSGFFSGWIELTLVLGIFPVSMIAFFPIWIKHKNINRLMEFIAGLILVAVAQVIVYSHEHGSFSVEGILEMALMISGTLLIAYATYKNRRHTHHCHNPHHAHV